MSADNGIDAARLTDFAAAVYTDAGMPPADARLVADTLVQADLWGHQSHGVLRLGWYLDRLRHGVMQPVTTTEFVVDAGAIAVIDGHHGVGHVLAMRGLKSAFGLPILKSLATPHRLEMLRTPFNAMAPEAQGRRIVTT